jgi:hypothetical protein
MILVASEGRFEDVHTQMAVGLLVRRRRRVTAQTRQRGRGGLRGPEGGEEGVGRTRLREGHEGHRVKHCVSIF